MFSLDTTEFQTRGKMSNTYTVVAQKQQICQKKGRTDPFPPVFHLQILAECSFPRRNRNKNPFSSWKIGEGGRFCGNDRVSLTVTIKDQQILDHGQVTNFNLERTLDCHLSTCQLVVHASW